MNLPTPTPPQPAPRYEGLGLPGVVFLVLMTLKLLGLADLSWWVVTAPLWAPALFVVLLALGFVAGVAVFSAIKALMIAHRSKDDGSEDSD